MHPVPPVIESYALEQGALVYTDPGFTVTVRPWDWRLAEEEIARATETSPFGDKPGDAGRFLFFRIRFTNRAAQPLVFNPLQATVHCEGEAPILPVENSDLYLLAPENSESDERGKVFRQLTFHETVHLRPGGTIERYLVFPAPEAAKAVVLALDDLWLGPKSRDLRFVFELFPGKAPDDARPGP
jgi:hypothetical protein